MKRWSLRHATLVIGLTLIAHAGIAGCPKFGPAASYPMGTIPTAITTADFNGDGRPDIAAADFSSAILVRLGNGSGGFGSLTSVPLAFGANGIVAGDFDRDGKTDLAVSGGLTNYAILIGNGAGGFASAVTHDTGPAPTAITAADFNRDGKLDLLTTHSSQGDAYVLFGVGDGTFSAPVELLAGDTPVFAAVADLNRDGIPDVAIANLFGDTAGVYIGAGDGSFADPVFYATGGRPKHIEAADFNGDGAIDLAISRGTPLGAMLLNNGNGTFASFVETGSSAEWAEIGDFNGDGKIDLARSRNTGVTMDIGDGAGSLTAFGLEFFVSDARPKVSAMADFNNDGLPDLAFLHTNDNNLTIVLNTSRCSANCAPADTNVRLLIGAGPVDLVTGDFNRDGRRDLFSSNSTGSASLLLGGPTGFQAAIDSALSGGVDAMVAADLNRDAKLDAVVTNTNLSTVTILSGDGAGGFTANSIAAGFVPYDLALADFNRDGFADLALANPNASAISVWINTGGGTFTRTNIIGATAPFFVTTGDFNRDGIPDLAYASISNTSVSIRLGNGTGGFGGATSYPAGTSPRAIAVADFNRDGKPDLAVTNIGAAPGVSILFGNGAGAFAAPVAYPTSQGANAIAVADLNRDGNPDLAVVNGQVVTLLAGTAAGTFASVGDFNTGFNPAAVVVGDFDRDGKLDLAMANGSSPSGFSNLAVLSTACPSAELTVVKSHSGSFTQGQTGAQYTMTVSNGGTAATSGAVSVVDRLPSGLIATALGGSGWSCSLATLVCTRTDALAVAGSYPPITLAVTVRSNASASLGNAAEVSGGGDLNPDNNAVEDLTTVSASTAAMPTNLVATAQSIAQIDATWDAVTGATLYRITRVGNSGLLQDTTATTSYTDLSVVPDTTYVYQVTTFDGGIAGPTSNKELATTMFFTDDPLVPTIKAVHFLELRAAVKSVRAAAGLSTASFTALAPGGVIKAIHLTELRTYLDEARLSLGVSAMNYADPIIAAGATTIKAVQIEELRAGVR